MARIYYREEKLSGQAVESNLIPLDLFEYIMNNSSCSKFDLKDKRKGLVYAFMKSKLKVFKHVELRRDGISYKAKEGDFFLPEAIILCDVFDYNFPTEFYFIAKIGKELELRKCAGGKDVEWHQIPELHQPVSDPKVIQRIEKSLLEVKRLIETSPKPQIEIKEEKDATPPVISPDEKAAYKDLVGLCVENETTKSKVLRLSEELDHDEEDAYGTVLEYFIGLLDEEEIDFIGRLDWAVEVHELDSFLKTSLKDNYDLSLKLPDPDAYGEEATVSFENVFEDYDQILRDNGLQLGFIDMESDEYVCFVHRGKDEEQVKEAVSVMGYGYRDAEGV